MSIRFAAAGTGDCAAVARVRRRPRLRTPANDCDTGVSQDLLLQSTLRHFSRFGLGAAEQARNSAARAFFYGDRQAYRHWLAVCRKLDRQMATNLRVPSEMCEG